MRETKAMCIPFFRPRGGAFLPLLRQRRLGTQGSLTIWCFSLHGRATALSIGMSSQRTGSRSTTTGQNRKAPAMNTRSAPDFALSFSSDAVHLMERTAAPGQFPRWSEVSVAPFDAPDFRAEMARLRRLAANGPEALVALIIPEDQILYTSLPVAAGADLGPALDGLTPYAVDELSWDWRPAGDDRLRVAAVARQTLREAEDFARSHGFAAAGFLGDPAEGQFPAVPQFRDDIDAEELPAAAGDLDLGGDLPEPPAEAAMSGAPEEGVATLQVGDGDDSAVEAGGAAGRWASAVAEPAEAAAGTSDAATAEFSEAVSPGTPDAVAAETSGAAVAGNSDAAAAGTPEAALAGTMGAAAVEPSAAMPRGTSDAASAKFPDAAAAEITDTAWARIPDEAGAAVAAGALLPASETPDAETPHPTAPADDADDADDAAGAAGTPGSRRRAVTPAADASTSHASAAGAPAALAAASSAPHATGAAMPASAVPASDIAPAAAASVGRAPAAGSGVVDAPIAGASAAGRPTAGEPAAGEPTAGASAAARSSRAEAGGPADASLASAAEDAVPASEMPADANASADAAALADADAPGAAASGRHAQATETSVTLPQDSCAQADAAPTELSASHAAATPIPASQTAASASAAHAPERHAQAAETSAPLPPDFRARRNVAPAELSASHAAAAAMPASQTGAASAARAPAAAAPVSASPAAAPVSVAPRSSRSASAAAAPVLPEVTAFLPDELAAARVGPAGPVRAAPPPPPSDLIAEHEAPILPRVPAELSPRARAVLDRAAAARLARGEAPALPERHPGSRGGVGALLVMLGALLLGLTLIWAFATPSPRGPDLAATPDAAGSTVAATAGGTAGQGGAPGVAAGTVPATSASPASP
ncbi:MAG TPA: hypothetical protein PKA35_00765, partial [Paracoccus solventivorans]|nr:hypothetical protein [Paracoccus solventivorans]